MATWQINAKARWPVASGTNTLLANVRKVSARTRLVGCPAVVSVRRHKYVNAILKSRDMAARLEKLDIDVVKRGPR